MKRVIKKCIILSIICLFVIGSKFSTYASVDSDTKKVEDVTYEIYNAIKDIDLKKVVALSDYNGTYDTRYLDQFFDKYEGSKDIVKSLLDTLKIDIKEIEKIENDRYKESLNIEMIDINKLMAKISWKVGIDILKSKFSMKYNVNDIINIVLKRIGEVLDKDSYEKLSFSYNIEFIDKNGSYRLCSKKIIENVYDRLKPILSRLK